MRLTFYAFIGVLTTLLLVTFTIVTVQEDSSGETVEITAPSKTTNSGRALMNGALKMAQTRQGMLNLRRYITKIEKKLAFESMERRAGLARVNTLIKQHMNSRVTNTKAQAQQAQMISNAKGSYANLAKAMRTSQRAVMRVKSFRKRHHPSLTAAQSKLLRQLSAARNKAMLALHHAAEVWAQTLNAVGVSKHPRISQTNFHIAANKNVIDSDSFVIQQRANKLLKRWFRKALATSARVVQAPGALAVSTQVTSEVAKFRRMLKRRAAQRYDANERLMHAAVRLQAALNAVHALNDPAFASKVGGVQQAKIYARSLVSKAETEFKVNLAALETMVIGHTEENEILKGEATTQMPSAMLLNSQVQRASNAEIRRMIYIADARYAAMKKGDPELKKLISESRAATPTKMMQYAARFRTRLAAIRRAMKRGTAPAAPRLQRSTAALYNALRIRDAVEGTVSSSVKASVASAKKAFLSALHGFEQRALSGEEKFHHRIAAISGLKGKKILSTPSGRELMRLQAATSRFRVNNFILQAIRAGYQQGAEALKRGKGSSDPLTHIKICTRIDAIRRRFLSKLRALQLTSSSARAQLHHQMLLDLKALARKVQEHTATALKASFRVGSSSRASALVQASSAAQAAAARLSLRRLIGFQQRILLSINLVASDRMQMGALVKESQHSLQANLQGMLAALMSKSKLSASTQRRARTMITYAIRGARKHAAPFTRMASRYARSAKLLEAAAQRFSRQEEAISALRASKTRKPVATLKLRAQRVAHEKARERLAMHTLSFVSLSRLIESRVNAEAAAHTGIVANARHMHAIVAPQVTMALAKVLKQAVTGVMKTRPAALSLKQQRKSAAGKQARAAPISLQQRKNAVAAMLNQARAMKRALDAVHTNAAVKWSTAQREVLRATKAYAVTVGRTRTHRTLRGLPVGHGGGAAVRERMTSALVNLANTVVASTTSLNTALRRARITPRRHTKHDAAAVQRALKDELNSVIVAGVQLGQAQAKRSAEKFNREGTCRAQVMAAEKVERHAAKCVFQMERTRRLIARNYLMLKAYISLSKKMVKPLFTNAQAGLMSLGDLLSTVWTRRQSRAAVDVGMGMGASKADDFWYDSDGVALHDAVGRLNGLVKEYAEVMATMRSRWRLGIGKYVLAEVDKSMRGRGVLRLRRQLVDGMQVSISPAAVGLQDQIKMLAAFAVPFSKYQKAQAKSAKAISTSQALRSHFMAPLPEWQGN